jgi:hypothetical protein
MEPESPLAIVSTVELEADLEGRAALRADSRMQTPAKIIAADGAQPVAASQRQGSRPIPGFDRPHSHYDHAQKAATGENDQKQWRRRDVKKKCDDSRKKTDKKGQDRAAKEQDQELATEPQEAFHVAHLNGLGGRFGSAPEMLKSG